MIAVSQDIRRKKDKMKVGRLFEDCCLCLFASFVWTSVAEPQWNALDEKVKYAAKTTIPQVSMCCRKNGDIFNRKECRLDRCRDLDELGTQLPITDEAQRQTKEWIAGRFAQLPAAYCSNPKKILVEDETLKRRQDYILKVVNALRDVVQYAYEQALLYEFDARQFEPLAKSYAELMKLRAWRDLGSRQGRNVEKAVNVLIGRIEGMHLLNVSIYDGLLLKKMEQHHAFLQRYPAMAVIVEAKISRREAQRQASRVQVEKQAQELEQWQREMREKEVREANRRGDNGEVSRQEQFRNDEVSQRAFRQVMKDVKKGRRRPLTAEEFKRVSTPATAPCR